MKKNLYIIILSVLSLVLNVACGDSDNPTTETPTKRTVVIYMVATNTLSSNALLDLAEIESTIQSTGTNGCRLLIYKDSYSDVPQLIEYKKGEKEIQTITLQTYDNTTASTTVRRMQQVFSDVQSVAPAEDYGLILWSHASGWANSLTARSNVSVLSFGDDSGDEMPIDELAEALPTDMFSFVYTDACYMAGIEVVYEIRNKIRYFIGSVTELPADGMDYTNNLPCFFADQAKLEQACKNTFNKYNSMSGSSRTCTMSLIDCSQLEALAQVCKEIYSIGKSSTPVSEIQRYKYTSPYLFYDLGQYVNSYEAVNEVNAEQIASLQEDFNTIMSKVVLYKATTPAIFNKFTIDEEYFSGLSTYIMGTTQTSGVNESYYKTLSWYKDVIEQ